MIEQTRIERIRRYFCTNQRRLHRRFLRYIGVAIFILSFISSGLLVYRDVMTRRMLNARARIQISQIKSGVRRGVFTEEEKQTICRQWESAEYNFVEANPFEDCK